MMDRDIHYVAPVSTYYRWTSLCGQEQTFEGVRQIARVTCAACALLYMVEKAELEKITQDPGTV